VDSSPVSTPPSAALAELAKTAFHCEPMARARRLASWVGGHRTLTAKGVLRPKDATQACLDLGIDFGGRRFRSALDVDELMRDWVTALAAGFVVVDGTRARGADPDELRSPDSDPAGALESWVTAATYLLDLSDYEPCSACQIALHELHTAAEPITMEQLASAVLTMVLVEPEDTPCRGCGQIHEDWGDYGDEDLAEHVVEMVMGLLAFDAADIADERIRLTSLGGFLAERVFQGLVVPPDADVPTVLSLVGAATALDVGHVLARPWLGARPVSSAVNELLAFAESATGRERVNAVAFAGELGTEAADTWREWAARPGFGAYARVWLLDHDEPAPEDPADEAWLAADGLCAVLESMTELASSDELLDAVFDQVPGGAAEAAKLVLSSDHPKAEFVAAWLMDHQEPEPDPTVLQLKITLLGVSNPPVWRRVLVPPSTRLSAVHRIIQQVMGWEDDHLHVFAKGRQQYGSPGRDLGFADDNRVRLSQLVVRSGDKFRYTYDFGDDWEHEIVMEKTLVAGLDETYPSCVEGQGACPPEDCGGFWGYANLKEVLADPAHEEHQNMLEWLWLDSGEDFNPDEFSAAEVNTRLHGPATPATLATT
jgi:hypothetical protein